MRQRQECISDLLPSTGIHLLGCLSVCLHIYLSIYLSIYIYLSVDLTVYLSNQSDHLYPSIHPPNHPSIYIYISISIHPSIHPSFQLSICVYYLPFPTASIFGRKEDEFGRKIHQLSVLPNFNLIQFEEVVDEIRVFVAEVTNNFPSTHFIQTEIWL